MRYSPAFVIALCASPVAIGPASAQAPLQTPQTPSGLRPTQLLAPSQSSWGRPLPPAQMRVREQRSLQARDRAFDWLDREAGAVEAPNLNLLSGRGDLEGWTWNRYRAVTGNETLTRRQREAMIAGVVHQDLQLAEAGLGGSDQGVRRRALRVASIATLYSGMISSDPRLQGALYEGFLLPNLELAPPRGWSGAEAMLEGASAAYRSSGRVQERREVLLTLLERQMAAGNAAGADMTRVHLADAFAAELQPTQITDPKGQTTSFNYHPNGLDVQSITNAKGQTVATYQYDSKHQPTQIQDITGTTTQLSYTAWGAPQTIEANGHTTQMTYNAKGFVAATQRDGVTLSQMTYDEKGRVATQTDQVNMTVAYEYNNLDHVTKEKYPDGTSVSYDYTCCGLPGVVTDRAGRKSYYDYDPMRRLARVQDADGNTLEMDYDAEGNLARLLDGKGNITKWQYTGAGQLSKKVYADGTEQNYAYAGGRLSASKDARNRVTNFLYDANGNLSKIDYPNDADVTLTYNSLDKPLSMTDALGTTTFGYDAAARLTSVDGPWNNDTVNYAYDSEGRRSALGVQKPDGTLDTTGYVYDALGRLDQITSSAGTFDYNYAGNTSRVTQLLMPNGAKTNYTYTALGELDVLHNVAANGSNISRYDYNYDARGVRAALQEQIEARSGENASVLL